MDHHIRWPMDFDRKPGRGPNLVFRPQGFLVVMLESDGEGRTAASALQDAGFAEQDVKLYTSGEILANYVREGRCGLHRRAHRYTDRRSPATLPHRAGGSPVAGA